jgi:hypothetical protein
VVPPLQVPVVQLCRSCLSDLEKRAQNNREPQVMAEWVDSTGPTAPQAQALVARI